MKKEDWIFKRLEKILEMELEYLKNHIIFNNGDHYDVFNIYEIVKQPNGSYQVSKNQIVGRNFSALKLALSWCVADKYKNNDLANNLVRLDKEKTRISNDILVRQALVNSIKDPERRELLKVKIYSKKQGLALIENRLAKCVSLAKYCQIRGFNRDETARTRRT